MPISTAEETLGEFFGNIALRNLIEKKLLGGYQISLGPLLTRGSFWVFQVGCILGRALRDHLEILVQMTPLTADGPAPEQKVCEILCKVTEDRMNRYNGEPNSLLDFWLKTEFNLDLDGVSIGVLKNICQRKVSLDEVFSNHKLDHWLLSGVGFGANYPDEFERLWSKTFEEIDDEVWVEAKRNGLPLPEQPQPLPLQDTEEDVLADTAAYTQRNFPELINALGLTGRQQDGDRR